MKYKIAFSTMRPARKLEHGDPDWGAFNGSFRNLELETIEIANEIYTGHAFTTWHANNWRKGDNYLLGQHIGLDFDTEDERSLLATLIKDRFISRYGSLAYTTPSHTPAKPKARVLFLLDTPIHQPANYVLAVRSLLWLFGESADHKCKDPCRFFYGSHSCDVEYLDNTLPLDTVKQIIQQYRATGATQKRTQERRYTPTANQEEVAAALRSIPPWQIDYDEWVAVLMGIHHEFGDSGLSLAESWADGKDNEVAAKWRSFKDAGNGTGTVTIATVFDMAKRFGWVRQPAQAA